MLRTGVNRGARPRCARPSVKNVSRLRRRIAEKGLAHRRAKPSAEPQQLGSFFRSLFWTSSTPCGSPFRTCWMNLVVTSRSLWTDPRLEPPEPVPGRRSPTRTAVIVRLGNVNRLTVNQQGSGKQCLVPPVLTHSSYILAPGFCLEPVCWCNKVVSFRWRSVTRAGSSPEAASTLDFH